MTCHYCYSQYLLLLCIVWDVPFLKKKKLLLSSIDERERWGNSSSTQISSKTHIFSHCSIFDLLSHSSPISYLYPHTHQYCDWVGKKLNHSWICRFSIPPCIPRTQTSQLKGSPPPLYPHHPISFEQQKRAALYNLKRPASKQIVFKKELSLTTRTCTFTVTSLL